MKNQENQEKSLSAKIGGTLGKSLGEGGKYIADLANSAVKGVVKLPAELLPVVGAIDEGFNIASDFATNLVTGGRGTNLSGKGNGVMKVAGEISDNITGFIDEHGSSNFSDFSKTDLGKAGMNITEFVSGMVIPIGGTTVKLGKLYSMLKKKKGAEKLVKELDTVFDAAKKGQKIEKSQIDSIFKKYSKSYDESKSVLSDMTKPHRYKGLNPEAKDVLKNIKSYTPEEIKAIGNPRLIKLYEFFKRNPKKSIAGLVAGTGLGAGFINGYIEGEDELAKEFESYLDSNPEINDSDTTEEATEEQSNIYQDREIFPNENGKFQFESKAGGLSPEFDTPEQAQQHIDEQLESYYKVELEKAEAAKDLDKISELVQRAKERGIDLEEGLGL